MVKRIMAEWDSLPNAVTKPVRDFGVAFFGLMVASGALNQGTPDWSLLWAAVVFSASNGAWRTLRAQLPGVQSG